MSTQVAQHGHSDASLTLAASGGGQGRRRRLRAARGAWALHAAGPGTGAQAGEKKGAQCARALARQEGEARCLRRGWWDSAPERGPVLTSGSESEQVRGWPSAPLRCRQQLCLCRTHQWPGGWPSLRTWRLLPQGGWTVVSPVAATGHRPSPPGSRPRDSPSALPAPALVAAVPGGSAPSRVPPPARQSALPSLGTRWPFRGALGTAAIRRLGDGFSRGPPCVEGKGRGAWPLGSCVHASSHSPPPPALPLAAACGPVHPGLAALSVRTETSEAPRRVQSAEVKGPQRERTGILRPVLSCHLRC